MKIIFLIIFSISLYANSSYELKLYDKVFTSLFEKEKINIYTTKKYKSIFKYHYRFNIVSDCNEADLIFSNIDSNCTKKPIFVKDYKSFKETKNVIGAFYYRKGRPQLKLNKKNIKKFNLNIDNYLKDYVE